MKILVAASEVFPFAKVGGLGDVIGSLPHAMRKIGVEACVFVPKYKEVYDYLKKNNLPCKTKAEGLSMAEDNGLPVYFVENDKYYKREGIYGATHGDHPDNLERYSYFCKKTLEYLKIIDFKPDIIHCHDWQTALIGVYLKEVFYKDFFYKGIKIVLTIHNMAYQGDFQKEKFSKLGLPVRLLSPHGLEANGKINLLKSGFLFCDEITTVSPQYAKEIQTEKFGCGLENVLKAKKDRLVGILNGIDYSVWNPATDGLIYRKFDGDNLAEKYQNKINLQKEYNLDPSSDIPLFGSVSRLVWQKGIDILTDALEKLCKRDLQVAILGTGEMQYHKMLKALGKKFKNLALFLFFDEALAHKIYASSDFFLMPSRYEPCGLGQMISFKYAALPIVTKVGGLVDTVRDISCRSNKGNGILLNDFSSESLVQAVERALKLYRDKKMLEKAMKNGLEKDFSWERSAQEYKQLFEQLRK